MFLTFLVNESSEVIDKRRVEILRRSKHQLRKRWRLTCWENCGTASHSLFHNIVIRHDDAFEPDTALDCLKHADSYAREDTSSRMTSLSNIIPVSTSTLRCEDIGKWRYWYTYSSTRYLVEGAPVRDRRFNGDSIDHKAELIDVVWKRNPPFCLKSNSSVWALGPIHVLRYSLIFGRMAGERDPSIYSGGYHKQGVRREQWNLNGCMGICDAVAERGMDEQWVGRE